MQTGGVRVFYGISTVSLRCFGDRVARTRTVTVRLPYAACTCLYGTCASTVRTCTCLRTPVEFYDHCTWPVRIPVSAHTGYWPRTIAYAPSAGEKRCACTTFRHGLLTGIRGLYGLKKTRTAPCEPVRARTVCRTITHGSLEFWSVRCPYTTGSSM